MRKNISKNKTYALRERSFDMVGVTGSIPVARTTLTIPISPEGIELSGDWELIPGIRNIRGRKVAFQVLRKNPAKRFENDLNGRRRSKSA